MRVNNKDIAEWKKEIGREWSDDYNYRDEYKKICALCQKEHSLRTQRDNNPEYYTSVFIKCDCGDYVYFSLPVN